MLYKSKKVVVVYLLITLIVFMVYGTAQQILRQLANEPQIQLARDLSNQLSRSTALASRDFPQNIDLSSSLSTFALISDENGKTLISTGTIGGSTPTLPKGVYLNALKRGENRITWQPQIGIREAIVVVPFTNPNNHVDQYIVVGRSLRTAEKLTSNLGRLLLLGWIVLIVISSILFIEKPKPVTVEPLKKRKKVSEK